MESPLDRRQGNGRRWSDHNAQATLGLLHDIANHLTTLSYLVEGLRGELRSPTRPQRELELLDHELSRLLDLCSREMAGGSATNQIEAVDLRSLAGELAQLARVTQGAHVSVRQGPPVCVFAYPARTWRVLSNLIDNACRAAGRNGTVEIDLTCADQTAIVDITDDGPGFGNGPPGRASLGLTVATSLLDLCGGTLDVASPRGGGTRVRIALPGHPTSTMNPTQRGNPCDHALEAVPDDAAPQTIAPSPRTRARSRVGPVRRVGTASQIVSARSSATSVVDATESRIRRSS